MTATLHGHKIKLLYKLIKQENVNSTISQHTNIPYLLL